MDLMNTDTNSGHPLNKSLQLRLQINMADEPHRFHPSEGLFSFVFPLKVLTQYTLVL